MSDGINLTPYHTPAHNLNSLSKSINILHPNIIWLHFFKQIKHRSSVIDFGWRWICKMPTQSFWREVLFHFFFFFDVRKTSSIVKTYPSADLYFSFLLSNSKVWKFLLILFFFKQIKYHWFSLSYSLFLKWKYRKINTNNTLGREIYITNTLLIRNHLEIFL